MEIDGVEVPDTAYTRALYHVDREAFTNFLEILRDGFPRVAHTVLDEGIIRWFTWSDTKQGWSYWNEVAMNVDALMLVSNGRLPPPIGTDTLSNWLDKLEKEQELISQYPIWDAFCSAEEWAGMMEEFEPGSSRIRITHRITNPTHMFFAMISIFDTGWEYNEVRELLDNKAKCSTFRYFKKCAEVMCEKDFKDITKDDLWKGATDTMVHYVWMSRELPPFDDDNWWMHREAMRYYLNVYEIDDCMHWDVTDPEKVAIFPHISLEDGGKYMVAFTENPAKGKRDIQTRTRFGRYLSRFKLTKDDKETKELVNYWTANYGDLELRWARTRQEIKEVYTMRTTSWSSCMQGWWEDPIDETDMRFTEKHHYHDIHPCEVYATDDVAVAYIMNGSRLAARTVVNMVKKQWSRIYGNEQLAEMLTAKGYENGDLTGCRILRLEIDGAIVAPYLDVEDSVYTTGDPKYLMVGKGGSYVAAADSTSGFLYAEIHYCHYCDATLYGDGYAVDLHDEPVCNSCQEDMVWASHPGWSGTNDVLVHLDEAYEILGHNGYFTQSYIDDNCTWSDYDDAWIMRDECIITADTDIIFHEDATDAFHLSKIDGEYYEHEHNLPEYEPDENEDEEVA